MKQILKKIAISVLFSLIITSPALAGSEMTGQKMPDQKMAGNDMSASDRIGNLFHESVVVGYMLSYYLMDLREKKGDGQKGDDMEKMDMEKPHHIMLYIIDKNHTPVLKGTVGFLIKDAAGTAQKAMAMKMGMGFGITADMKQKGVYTISAKALVNGTKLMDSFEYEIK
ncbi:conserved hypothetical protein [Desulforapulum autotrophicum HRM2]|uniref:YtkA-like domain-containing protein n=1 Tax=Desulforapulum autotrophicum (strain ATCC 43914 / DSM 3382 / VKM B-1955 / HRM2) TaxID=177437 RepID=C0QE50_DESAH|nr:hypothetical protein [Desulforapulum autotrophicum]ACN13167.1 conserved hypothetical protein [Desulforapulum autotrophicum HRM2]